MDDGQDRMLHYRLPSADGRLVRRLLLRDGFAVLRLRPTGTRDELSVTVESDGRAARVRELMARWAPGATLLDHR